MIFLLSLSSANLISFENLRFNFRVDLSGWRSLLTGWQLSSHYLDLVCGEALRPCITSRFCYLFSFAALFIFLIHSLINPGLTIGSILMNVTIFRSGPTIIFTPGIFFIRLPGNTPVFIPLVFNLLISHEYFPITKKKPLA